MTLQILLTDHWTASTGPLKAGLVLDDSEPRFLEAQSTFAPIAAYVPTTMDPVLAAYRAVRSRSPSGSDVSLYAMFRSAGLIA